jgi:hypothetical protein
MGLSKLKQKIHSKLGALKYSNDSPEIHTGDPASVWQQSQIDQGDFATRIESSISGNRPSSLAPATTTLQSSDLSKGRSKSAYERTDNFATPGTSTHTRTMMPLTDKELSLETKLGVTEQEKQKARTEEERRAYVREYLRNRSSKSVHMMGVVNPFSA